MWAAKLDPVPGQVRRRRRRKEGAPASSLPYSALHDAGLREPVLMSHEPLCFPRETAQIMGGERTLDP